jgi:hypothetical protein
MAWDATVGAPVRRGRGATDGTVAGMVWIAGTIAAGDLETRGDMRGILAAA